MLEVKVILNSSIEEILAFKCCSLPGQNMEIHVRNAGEGPVVVAGMFLLENAEETFRCDNLYPPWERVLAPGEAAAFYGSLDASIWERYETLVLFDKKGNAYRFSTQDVAGC